MTTKQLHMIGNAHIDPVWLWQWPEGVHEVLASFRSALDRMNEDDDFIFVSSSAAFYHWVERTNPAMFAEIQQRVAEGRWEIVGGWWIQPDCNIPSGESFVRQALYAQRYFQEKFGVTAKVGYNVDSFGHAGSLPQILKKSGMDYYVFMRPNPQEKGLPSRLFWWESADGSRVLTFRIPFSYNSNPRDVERVVERTAAELKSPYHAMMCFYGVGNHGGGPTKANIANIRAINVRGNMPDLLFSSCNRYFATVENQPNLPVVNDDLQHHASGCYAAHSGIKQWNRQAENRLIAAEKFATIATRTTQQTYPTEFERAWRNVLFNQFHDILAGTSLEAAYVDARDMHGEAMNIGAWAMNDALQSLAWNIKIPLDETTLPIVVFNPHAWRSQVNIEVELGWVPENTALIDNEGNQIAWQLVQSEATAMGRKRLSFNADLPALGYRVYHLVSRPNVDSHPSPITATDTMLNNGLVRLTFDAETGYLTSLYDISAETEVFGGDAAKPVVLHDDSDTWGHNVFTFNDVIGAFSATKVELVAHGPVKAVIRVTSEYSKSQLVQDFTLYPNSKRVEVRGVVNWQEQFKMLKLRFPTNFHLHKITHEIPYGHIERFANGEEETFQNWVDISGAARDSQNRYGVSILNDGKYSGDVMIRDIGLTVIRSPIYAHHIPKEPQPDEFYSFIDQGVQRFNYVIYPHDGGWEEARTVQRAAELNQRPIPLVATFHPDGTLPQADSFAESCDDNVVISIVKQHEDSDDLIVRAYETTRTATTAILNVMGREFSAEFAPCEIKTFRIPGDGRKKVVEVSMLEWEEENADTE